MKQQVKQYVIVFLVTAVLIVLAGCAPGRAGMETDGRFETAAAEMVVEEVRSAPAARPAEFSFYTEQYWEMAAAPVFSAEETAGDAFYTEQYWKLAEERAAAVQPQQAPFYTAHYWQMAEQYAAGSAAEQEASFAYYTERYWNMSK